MKKRKDKSRWIPLECLPSEGEMKVRKKQKKVTNRTDLPPVWAPWEVWSGRPSEPGCPPHPVCPLHERRTPPLWTPLASSWLLLASSSKEQERMKKKEGGGGKVVEKETERSAADSFWFSLRVEEATGCFQESLKSWALPTERRRGGASERAVQHTCLSLSPSL